MATHKDEEQRQKKKRRILEPKKLLLNQKVEVRSIEDRFLGSWRVGTVIGCGEQTRHIKYDEILNNDVEVVKVSPVLDGHIPGKFWTNTYYRGNIRPLPPLVDFQKLSLHYGQCIDVFVQDAWWEGVILDHEDGSDERKVFFPDSGDESKTRIDMLRITQDWDEATEEWKLRGNWVLLELLEEVELAWPRLVSVRQVWYEIRMKLGFEKLKEWTYSSKDIWKELVWQVLCTSYNLTMKQICHEISSAGEFVEEGKRLLGFSEPAFDAGLKPEGFFSNFMAVVSQLDGHAKLPPNLNYTSSFHTKKEVAFNGSLSSMVDGSRERSNLVNSMPSPYDAWFSATLTPFSSLSSLDDNVEIVSGANSKGFCAISSEKKLKGKHEPAAGRNRLQWLSAGSDMVLGAENCPDSVAKYIKMGNSRHGCSSKFDVRKHLIHLGWKIQYAIDGRMTRMRYISPEEKIYYSLHLVCLGLQSGKEFPSTCQDKKRNKDDMATSLISSQLTEIPQAKTRASKVVCDQDIVHVENELNREAVVEYSQFRSKMKNCHIKSGGKTSDITTRAKKHLSAVGWTFFYRDKKGRMELRYKSPCGRTFYSLLTACEWCLSNEERSARDVHACKQAREEGTGQLFFQNSASLSVCLESEGLNGELSKMIPLESSSGKSLPKQLVQKGGVKVQGTRKQPKKRKHYLPKKSSALLHSGRPRPQKDCSPLLERVKDSPASIKERGNMNAELPACVLASSKRARQVVVPSTHRTPRTILSWLIDGKIVLPRAKVHYRHKNADHPMKEGTITREGIKCSCCHNVFTLSKFEAHAGSNYHRPSANIFLEDGRSLFECQRQLKHEDSVRNRSEPHQVKGKRHCHPNEDICSVCHYGGELVLCDQCPSSFHTSCLGLKDIPDGDWFCPSCCCGICGLGRFKENKELPSDDSFLNCSQCEHQYHIGCLRIKGLVKPDYYPEGNWFCNKRCEQIHSGLQNLLGKSIPVGCDNLVWTLLKNKTAEDSAHGNLDNEHLMESYSKLNVALSIMHECFEPMKDRRTKRDIVEDVVFSRWSKLNRLNFQGFYTVVLERNEEVITIATVRVYGEKVAEIPIVATRFKYRRLGMCRVLMNELEKKLMELGVQMLVLPAVPSMLNTWETSFQFSRMKDSERLNFLDYTFLDFPGTVMCQKLLKNIPSDFSPSTGISLCANVQQKVRDHDIENEVYLECNSAVSEVLQEDQIEENHNHIVDQGTADLLRGGIGSNICNNFATSAIEVSQPPEPVNQLPEQMIQTLLVGQLSCQNQVKLDFSVQASNHKEAGNARNNIFKVYKRRSATVGN